MPRRLVIRTWLGATVLFTLACARDGSTGEGGACDSSAESNRARVLAFYRDGLVNRSPRPAFAEFMAADFVEHKPDVPTGTRDSTAAFLERLMQELPDGRWQIHRSLADRDLVFVHASFTPAPDAPAYAIADVFRLHECKIVEHWDVVGPPVERSLNPQPRF
jgi:predicted SnoaL-like aldol condensation-catalyzing enzyme